MWLPEQSCTHNISTSFFPLPCLLAPSLLTVNKTLSITPALPQEASCSEIEPVFVRMHVCVQGQGKVVSGLSTFWEVKFGLSSSPSSCG